MVSKSSINIETIQVANFVGEREVLTMANCGQMPQYVFDLTLSSIWPGPALYSGGCYLLQMQGDNTNLGCMCAEASISIHLFTLNDIISSN